MTRIAFCITILFGAAACLSGGSSFGQGLRAVDSPAADNTQVRLASPQQALEPLPPLDSRLILASNSSYVVAAPPPASSAPGAPPSIMPYAPGAPAGAAPSGVGPSLPGETIANPEAEPTLGLLYDTRVNNWIDPNAPTVAETGPAQSLDVYAIPPGNTNPPPPPPTSGWLKGGFLHGGLLRNFLYGNDGVRASANTGSNELWAGLPEWSPPVADRDPRYGVYLWESYELFRQLPDGTTKPHGSSGVNQGFNLGTPIPWLEQYGFGAQMGMSYGAFNLGGDTIQQGFMTTGIFRRADADRPVAMAFVYDRMVTNDFGAYQNSFSLGQFRAQIAYCFTARNEFGFWGVLRQGQINKLDALGQPIQYRGISQGSLFWHHKFGPGKAEVWVFTGLPDDRRLNPSPEPIGAPGNDFESNIYGYMANVPITDQIMAFSNFQAVHFTGGASQRTVYDFMVGLRFFPSGNARTRTVAGQSWMPYLPVANNGTFMIDTNQTF